jgi:hypothetical protein
MLRRPDFRGVVFVAVTFAVLTGLSRLVLPMAQARAKKSADPEVALRNNATKLLADGQQIFRYDTFGDEDFRNGSLRLNEVVATLTPRQALGLGLKVDAEALSPSTVEKLKHGRALRHAARPREPLRPVLHAGIDGPGEGRLGRVPEVATNSGLPRPVSEQVSQE